MSEIMFSTSFDDRYPPTNILNNSNSQFWTSTGLYPQEIFISLDRESNITSANIVSYNIKKIAIETSENDSAVNYVRQAEQNEVLQKENKLQDFSLNFNTMKGVKIIKITINEGYDEFCSINKITFK